MARKRAIILSFAMQKLAAAEATAKRVITAVQKSKELARDVKRELITSARERLKEIRAQKAAQLELERLQKRGAQLQAQARRPSLAITKTIDQQGVASVRGTFNDVFEIGNKLARGEFVGAGLNLVGELGGPLGRFAAGLTTKLIEMVDQHLQRDAEIRSAQLSAQLDEIRYRADYQRRLKDEPAFRRSEAARTWAEVQAQESAAVRSGRGRSADFLDQF